MIFCLSADHFSWTPHKYLVPVLTLKTMWLQWLKESESPSFLEAARPDVYFLMFGGGGGNVNVCSDEVENIRISLYGARWVCPGSAFLLKAKRHTRRRRPVGLVHTHTCLLDQRVSNTVTATCSPLVGRVQFPPFCLHSGFLGPGCGTAPL